MGVLNEIYGASLSLLTDFYQFTMAYGYWKKGMAEQEGVFHLFFRENPFKGGYTVAAGLEQVIDYVERFSFNDEDIAFLGQQKAADGKPLFEAAFLDYLRNLRLTCQIDAVPEGTVVFPHQPLIRVQGPMLQCQLLETPLLNFVNYATLIATKAARIAYAAKNEPVLEFGLRRAQGIDGGLTASRAAYIGGCTATSNVMAAKLYGIPLSGTHAHSWIMSFTGELEAFYAYAEVLPQRCILLVDTYDTLQGIENAIEVGLAMRKQGKELLGIRIDSGDLAWFSMRARELLDQAGLNQVQIVASNDLDEYLIQTLKEQEAKITVWGVGTKLATAFDQPALGGVYKLSALQNKQGEWQYKVKLSEQSAKVNTPGILQVRRFYKKGQMVADMLYNENSQPAGKSLIVDPTDATRRRFVNDADMNYEDLLVPVFTNGQRLYQLPTLTEIRQRVTSQLKKLDKSVKRFVNPHGYPVGLEESLFDLKTQLILQNRKPQEP